MRFHSDGPSIPDVLLERCDAGRVVFLCGAGVSLPSGMPTFVGLTKHVVEFFDPPADSDIMKAFRPWLEDEAGAKARFEIKPAAKAGFESKASANVPLDQIFNLLHLEYGKDEVNALVTQRLRAAPETEEVGWAHSLIRRISSSGSSAPKIVTTNFDRLFESGREGALLDLHVPPAFPDLNFGSGIGGITYLHGRLVDATSEVHPYVLSSADFGRAYLSEGWATHFVRHLLERYTVVLVGYQAEDPPIKYLLQGLNHDGKFDRSRLYAFDRGLPEEIEAKWRDRGVSAIAYAEHDDLWKTMAFWAERADDPRGWRAAIIATCQHDPKILFPHERGQVAHVLRSVQGARLFAEADPLPHPEWVCVLDAYVRSAKPSRRYGDDAQSFDPGAAYGLDDDLTDVSEEERKQGVGNDNLLVWRDEDDSPHAVFRLSGPAADTAKRLTHLITWMGRSIDSPVLAWWAIRQSALHHRLLERLERQVLHAQELDPRGRHFWNLIFEHHRDPRNRPLSGDWFVWKNRLAAEGWSAGVLREFRRVATPRLSITLPYGLAQSRPPSGPWGAIRYGDLGQFDIVFLKRYNDELVVPDSFLLQVFGVLEEQLHIASGLLADIGTAYFTTPSCYPDRDAEASDDNMHADEIARWFIQLFDRMAEKWPELAFARVGTWSATEQYFFRKLKLYGLSKSGASQAQHVADAVLLLPEEAFWDTAVARELLFLLVDRWDAFPAQSRVKLMDRVLAGAEYRTDSHEVPLLGARSELAARYGRYLALHGCAMTVEQAARLARLIGDIPGWCDAWATALVTERGSHAEWIGTDETPDVLMNLPVTEILAKAGQAVQRDLDTLTDKIPFTGLVKADPRKALSALTIASRHGEFSHLFWAPMISNFPPNAAARLRRVFLNRLARLPYTAVVGLGRTFGRWLVQNLVTTLKFDGDLGWAVYDHIVDALFAVGADATKSDLNEFYQRGTARHPSRRTFEHATAGVIGDCATALFHAVPEGPEQAGLLIEEQVKSRVERLFAAPGDGADHAVSIACSQLNRLMFIDPDWTTERLVPMLAFDHPFVEPAWNGFLHGNQPPWPPLAVLIKPQLLNLFPWVEGFAWQRDLSTIAARWLGKLRVFHHDHPGGLSPADMRRALRAMSDDTRNHFIFWMAQVGQKHAHGWADHIIPLIVEDWPRERRYRTAASMRAWIALLGSTGNSFQAVYEAVKRFLVAVETTDQPFYRFTREVEHEDAITVLFPDTTLDLMHRATPPVLMHAPYELPKVLAVIAEVRPALQLDQRYLRLIELVERS